MYSSRSTAYQKQHKNQEEEERTAETFNDETLSRTGLFRKSRKRYGNLDPKWLSLSSMLIMVLLMMVEAVRLLLGSGLFLVALPWVC